MKLICLGSSSKANGYILQREGEALVIEAGVPLKDAKKALGWNTRAIRGCLVSHSHKDHGGYYMEYAKAGIPVLAPVDVFITPHNRNRPVQPGKGYRLGGFSIVPFEVEHDVVTYGYVIEHPAMGRAVFVTDTYVLEYTIPGVNHWLIECNYDASILERRIDSGRENPGVRQRLRQTHMELQTTKEVLGAPGGDLKNIVLLHLSDTNSNEKDFISQVTAHTGARVCAADKGLEVDLSNEPF